MIFDEYREWKVIDEKKKYNDEAQPIYIYRTLEGEHHIEYSSMLEEFLNVKQKYDDDSSIYRTIYKTIEEKTQKENGISYWSILEELPQRIKQYKANANLPCVLYQEDTWRVRQKQGYNELLGEAWYQTNYLNKYNLEIDLLVAKKEITDCVINRPEELKRLIGNKKNSEKINFKLKIENILLI